MPRLNKCEKRVKTGLFQYPYCIDLRSSNYGKRCVGAEKCDVQGGDK